MPDAKDTTLVLVDLVNLLKYRNDEDKGFYVFTVDVFMEFTGVHKISEIFLSYGIYSLVNYRISFFLL